MARKAIRNSIFKRTLIGAVCLLVALCLRAPVAMAQHGGGMHGGGFGGGHFGGGGTHSGASARSGGTHAGASGRTNAPRGTAMPTAPEATTGVGALTGARGSVAHSPVALVAPTRFNSSSLAFRPRPVPHPTPQPQPIFFVPVFFGGPFFYGGFNSFWGCDPFWGWGPGCYSPFYGYGGYGYNGFGYRGWGYGGYYGGFYNGWGWGGAYPGFGANTGSNLYSSSPSLSAQDTAPAQTYVAPSYPTDTRSRDLVELFFKDGTVFDVMDYWVADGQLHFLTVDARGEKAVEHVVPFDTLDLQTTVDDNTSRGFKFQLRGESMEQYFRNHPEVVPKVDPEAPKNP
jgi:hypothetical protein